MLNEIQSFYNNLFKELKEYLTNNSVYTPYVFKQEPESKLFPLVIVKNTSRVGTYTTLNYADVKYSFALQINVYAIDKDGISGRTICEEITNNIENFFTNRYRMNISINAGMINIDEDVDRTLIDITCTLDTKFKDRIVILPD